MAKTYDPKRVIAIWGAITFTGLVDDGEAISVEYDEDHVTKKVGLDGEVARAMSANRTGKITVRLMATSMSNDLLSAAAVLDQVDRSADFPFTIKELSGRTLVFTSSAWIMKTPGPSYGKEIGTREWVFDCAQMDAFVGGII